MKKVKDTDHSHLLALRTAQVILSTSATPESPTLSPPVISRFSQLQITASDGMEVNSEGAVLDRHVFGATHALAVGCHLIEYTLEIASKFGKTISGLLPPRPTG